MRVLVLSAGRRTTLVRLFAEALAPIGGTVIVADVDGLAPAAHLGHDAFRVPRVNSPDYEEALLALVRDNAVGAVIPTIDTELLPLSRARQRLSELGCRAIVSHRDLLEVAADKLQTAEVFAADQIRVPRWWTPESALQDPSLPGELFVKPRFGSASEGAQPVTTETLIDVLASLDRPIIQERVSAQEVTVDALFDFDSKPIHYVPRHRIKTLGGESIQGVTIDDAQSTSWIKKVLGSLSRLGASGPITIQYFETNDEPTLLEINPRFGGGFPLGHAAGGKYPEWIIEMLSGETPHDRLGDYRRGLYMTRTMTERFLSSPLW